MNKIKLGISIGDVNGIGLEVILKTFYDSRMLELCCPIVYGSSKVLAYHKKATELEDIQFHNLRSIQDRLHTEKLNVINAWQDNVNIQLGEENEIGGTFAMRSLAAAVDDLTAGDIDCLVTAPLSKKAVVKSGLSDFVGHTEYLTDRAGADESLMLMVADQTRVGIVTNHIPVNQVASALTSELILKKITLLNATLKKDFGIEKPMIAVTGLNPHAGENGVIGDEDVNIIKPALEQAKNKGITAMGPFPADGLFGGGEFKKFDAVLTMYHDQGLIPFKVLADNGGVNYTAGLSFVRTSPDHGTAFGLAGKNKANIESFRAAVFTAIDIFKCRSEYEENHSNPLKRRNKKIHNSKAGDIEE